jgi:leader peptidase (prepilin peptidase)/N-methyltransferase
MGCPDAFCPPPARRIPGGNVLDTAAAGSASLLLIAGIGLAGACLGLLADAVVRRTLPQLAGAATARLGITTAAATFALSALLAWRFGSTPELPAYVVLGVFAVQLARIDIVHHLLPNRLIGPLLLAGLALLAVSAGVQGTAGDLIRGLAGSAILFIFYLILALTSGNGLGMGDVKLAAPLGLYLGYLGWSQLFYGGAFAFVAGGVVSTIVLLKNRRNKPKEVAYGPSMLAAGLAVILLHS